MKLEDFLPEAKDVKANTKICLKDDLHVSSVAVATTYYTRRNPHHQYLQKN